MRFAFLVLALRLLGPTAVVSDARPGPIQYWSLPTGSRIAYVHYFPPVRSKATPIIFLHGGPGAFIVDHSAAADQFYRSLATLGFDVYLYDQIGSGHSERLRDPRQYTVERHISDLEAIRQRLHSRRVILIGDSWGAALAANYIAQHPESCAKAIFAGPGAMDGRDMQTSTYPDAPMVKAAEAWFTWFYSQPRYAGMRDIQSADVVALYRSIAERELDAQLDEFVHRSASFLVCDPAKLPTDAVGNGMGWWVNLMTSIDFGSRRRDLKPALARTHTPVLILRGGCDFMRWEVAYEYKRAFPNATLLYVPEAGHAFGYDQPSIYSSAIRAFVQDRPLPVAPYTSTIAPPRVTPRALH